MPFIQKKGETKEVEKDEEKEKEKCGKKIRSLAWKDAMTKKKAKTIDRLAGDHKEHHAKGERDYPEEDIHVI